MESDKKVTQASLLQKNLPEFSVFMLLALFCGTEMDLCGRRLDLMRLETFRKSQFEGAGLTDGGGRVGGR